MAAHQKTSTTASGMGLQQSQAGSSVADHYKTPQYLGTRFSNLQRQDHTGAIKRTALDANDIRFNMGTLIFDENDKIEKQLKARTKADDAKVDPFMKEFLKRKAELPDTSGEKVSASYFHQRNRSV